MKYSTKDLQKLELIDGAFDIDAIFQEDKWLSAMNIIIRPEVKTIVSSIQNFNVCLVYENISSGQPISAPAKLLAILYNRFKSLENSCENGINIITPYLKDDNVKKLEAFIIELVHVNQFDPYFIDWIEHRNFFSNSITN